MTILDDILETKYEEVKRYRQDDLPERTIPIRPRLADRIASSNRLEVIAEIKRASPSKGVIDAHLNAVKQAKLYADGGAAAISVLTDSTYFKGSFDDLQEVATAIELPVLCKDFVVDSVQIDRAYAYGASIVLLIVAALEDEQLRTLYHYAISLGLEVLVEVHDEEELEKALRLGAELIGVNNRDLKTFTVSLDVTERLSSAITSHANTYLISESGIYSKQDAERLSRANVRGLLVGESLVRSSSVSEAVADLRVRRHTDGAN